MPDPIYAEASESDVELIQSAATESWHAAYKDIYPTEYISNFLQQAYSTEALLESISNPGSIFLVAKNRNQVIGFCHFDDMGNGPELLRLYVIPSGWGAGIGTHLLHLIESSLIARGLSEYFCYVHSQNEIGKAFYHKMGFVHNPTHDTQEDWYMYKRLRQLNKL